MKIKIIATCILGGLVFAFCNKMEKMDTASSKKEQFVVGSENTSKIYEESIGLDALAWYPEGSIVTRLNDNEVTVKVPEGWSYIYKEIGDNENLAARMVAGGSGGISCTFTQGSGCHPFVSTKGGGGCFMTQECGSCTQGASIGYTFDGTYQNVEVSQGGYVNLNQEITFAKVEEVLPSAFQAMFEIVEIAENLEQFLSDIQGGSQPEPIFEEGHLIAPDGYVFAAVNVYGRALTVLVTNEVADNYNLNISGVISPSFACTCNGDGSGMCEVKQMGGAYGCVSTGDCEPCVMVFKSTLTVSSYNSYKF